MRAMTSPTQDLTVTERCASHMRPNIRYIMQRERSTAERSPATTARWGKMGCEKRPEYLSILGAKHCCIVRARVCGGKLLS
eukprot:2358668-Pyramimonas_sp.AAC.1